MFLFCFLRFTISHYCRKNKTAHIPLSMLSIQAKQVRSENTSRSIEHGEGLGEREEDEVRGMRASAYTQDQSNPKLHAQDQYHEY